MIENPIVMLTFRDDPKSYFTSSRTALGRQDGYGKLYVPSQALLTTTLPPLQLGLAQLTSSTTSSYLLTSASSISKPVSLQIVIENRNGTSLAQCRDMTPDHFSNARIP